MDGPSPLELAKGVRRHFERAGEDVVQVVDDDPGGPPRLGQGRGQPNGAPLGLAAGPEYLAFQEAIAFQGPTGPERLHLDRNRCRTAHERNLIAARFAVLNLGYPP
jgi:hypothetical protein